MTKSYRMQTKLIAVIALAVVAIVGFNTNAWTAVDECDAWVYSSWQDSQPNCSTICGDVDQQASCTNAFGSCASGKYLHDYSEQQNNDGQYRCRCLIACDVEDCELESCP